MVHYHIWTFRNRRMGTGVVATMLPLPEVFKHREQAYRERARICARDGIHKGLVQVKQCRGMGNRCSEVTPDARVTSNA